MKKYILLASISLTVMLGSCKKDNITLPVTLEGKWAITSFIDNGTDKTSQLNSYNFTFDKNGNLAVNSGGMMNNMCNWTKHDSIYHFNMDGMHNGYLSMMDDDWIMTNLTDSICNFIDHNPNRICLFEMHRR